MNIQCAIRRKLRNACFVLLASVVCNVYAESWRDLGIQTEFRFFQLDVDSVEPNGNSQDRLDAFTAVWRTGSTVKQPYWLKRGNIHCATESITQFETRYVQSDPYMKKNTPDQVTDYLSGKKYFGTSTSDIPSNEISKNFEFPNRWSNEGAMVASLCQDQTTSKAKRFEMAKSMQKALDCYAKSNSTNPLCGIDDETLEVVYALRFRMMQAQEMCELPSSQASKITLYWVQQSMQSCEYSKQNCNTNLIKSYVYNLSEDLSRRMVGQKCSYLDSQFRNVIEENDRQEAAQKFKTCVKQNLARLDDMVSPANIVAEGVYSACRSYLRKDLAFNRQLQDGVVPTITAQVLERRSSAKRSKPNEPLRQKNSPSL